MLVRWKVDRLLDCREISSASGQLRPAIDHTTAVLDLHLASGSFTWSFISVDGQILDLGTQQPHRPVRATATTYCHR